MIFVDPMTITLRFELKVIKDDKMLVLFSDSALGLRITYKFNSSTIS